MGWESLPEFNPFIKRVKKPLPEPNPFIKRVKITQRAVDINPCNVIANVLSTPPGEYVRKNEIQRNWRGLAQAVEHAV